MAYITGVTPMRDRSGGELLRRRMEADGVSQRELSRRTGVDVKTVRAIVRGERDGNMATWRAFSRALRCTLDEIAR